MSYRCDNTDCAYPETGVCPRKAEFPDPETQCIDLRRGREAAGTVSPAKPSVPPPPTASSAEEPATELDPPTMAGRFWSGFALGGEEAGAMLWDPSARLFTLIGGEKRGKTSFLTALYIQLANGFTREFPWRFCGSRSLRGFQRLTDKAFEWKGGTAPIVPRTTHGNYRQPSFLHAAFRPRTYADAKTTQVLLTDMPGEWFDKWIDFGSQGLPETLEFLPRSDGFLVAIDAPGVISDRAYREDVRYTLDRLVTFLTAMDGSRAPIALVLTKYDLILEKVPIPAADERRQPAVWGLLRASLASFFQALDALPAGTHWDIFPTAAFSRPLAQPVGVLAPLHFLLKQTTCVAPMAPITIPGEFRGNFFEVFREEA